jgi:hypothetical protein
MADRYVIVPSSQLGDNWTATHHLEQQAKGTEPMALADWPLVVRVQFGSALHAGREVPNRDGAVLYETRCGARDGVWLNPVEQDLGASCNRCLRMTRR